MALLYSQFVWGFEVFDSGATAPNSQNNNLDFTRTAGPPPTWTASAPYVLNQTVSPTASPGTQFWRCIVAGTSGSSQPTWSTSSGTVTDGGVIWQYVPLSIAAGVYTADELAGAIATVLNTADHPAPPTNLYSCTFDWGTLAFTISTSGSAFSLALGSDSHSLAGLLGFSGDKLSVTSVTSDAPAGTAPTSTAKLWTAADPLVYNSPVAAQAAGTAAKLTGRAMAVRQHITDGATVESVYIGTLRMVQIAFRAISSTEQTNMEAFLDWAVQGKRFTWQPDKTSANLLKLVLANPQHVANGYEWLTRPEVGYGTLTFFEQLS